MTTESEIRKLCEEVEEYCSKATPGPLTYEKRESFRQGSWHYAIKTTYNPPEHPWSPRFVAWMCGSLGEATPSRRNPDDARTDPQIEADCEFFSRARTDLPKLIAALRECQREREEARKAREHTWDWIRRHYGKLEDWARKQLPEPYATEFFNCVANGTSHHTRSDYFRQDEAGKQLVYDQMHRAESAEQQLQQMKEALREYRTTTTRLVDALHWALDIMTMYEGRLIQFGDPKELVHSAVHVNRFSGARAVVEYAWQLLNESSECSHCRDGNIPLEGFHNYADGPQPCAARALLSGKGE